MKKIFAILLSALALGGCENDGIPYVCFRLEGETGRYALVPPDGSCVYAAELDPDTDRYCITGVF